MASFFMWKKKDFIQVLCRRTVNFSSMVTRWIIFSILDAAQHVYRGHFFQNHAVVPKRKKHKNKQSGLTAAEERILSFISSFPCFFRDRKIFSLKKTAIVTCIKRKNKKIEINT